jgi:nitroreductase
MTGIDVANADRLLTTTRAVRRRLDLDRPVSRELIEECIDVALQAPMGANIVRIRWLIVDDPAMKEKIAAIYVSSYQEYRKSAVERMAAIGRDENDKGLRSADHLASVLGQVPALVIPCHIERPPADPTPYSLSVFYGSVMPAVWSLILALRSRGLGSSLTTLHLQCEAEVAELLGIPPTATQLAMLPVAWFTGDDFRAVPRKPAAAYTYFNGWKRGTGR